jgi:hypothetical protein
MIHGYWAGGIQIRWTILEKKNFSRCVLSGFMRRTIPIEVGQKLSYPQKRF